MNTLTPNLAQTHDRLNPDPDLALLLDQAAPIAEVATQAMLNNLRSRSRRLLLPLIRLFSKIMVGVIGTLRAVLPNTCTSSKWLHRSIHWGLRNFVRSEANLLILRHFHLGSQVLGFIADNANVAIQRRPLTPKCLTAVEDNLFVQHDLNLFNFVIELNQSLIQNQSSLPSNLPVQEINFDSISEELDIEPLPNRWSNVLDLESAIHLYTPVYQLLLSDTEFSRAVASLQLDESIGIYLATLLGTTDHLHLISNRHPLVATRHMDAAQNLVLHGLGTERLHHRLLALKQQSSNAH